MLYTNFHTKIWYTLESEQDSLTPTRFLLTTIPYRIYSQLLNHQVLPNGFNTDYSSELLLDHSILTCENLIGYSIGDSWADSLPNNVKLELLNAISKLYMPDKEFQDTLSISLDLAINPRFDNTWECSVCQAKKLDKQRNCPFLDPEEYHEDSYSIQVLDEVLRVCPMNKKDTSILQQAFEARDIRSNNNLPEVGGLGDQTIFFVLASQKMNSVIKYYERKQLDDSRAG